MTKKNLNFKKSIVTTKTPLRISFAGGGTDMPYFYEKFNGATLSTTIDKFVYVTVKTHENFGEKYRLNYSETEILNQVNKIKNLRIKETLKYFKINEPLYVNTISDLPYNTGLGSSSSFLIGLIKGILSLQGKTITKQELAEIAFKIENKITKNSLGKQDHYIASFGGMNLINYTKKKIKVTNLKVSQKNEKILLNNLLFFFTGKSRSANKNLDQQKKNLKKNTIGLIKLKNSTHLFIKEFKKKDLNLFRIGKILDNTWKIKRQFTNKISDKYLDNIYNKALSLGCYGGKLLGAGGGGFFIFVCKKKLHKKVIKKLNECKKINFSLSKKGSESILID